MHKEAAALVTEAAAVPEERVPHAVAEEDRRGLVECRRRRIVIKHVRGVRRDAQIITRQLGDANLVIIPRLRAHARPDNIARPIRVREKMEVTTCPRGIRDVGLRKASEGPERRRGRRRDVDVAVPRVVVVEHPQARVRIEDSVGTEDKARWPSCQRKGVAGACPAARSQIGRRPHGDIVRSAEAAVVRRAVAALSSRRDTQAVFDSMHHVRAIRKLSY